METKKLKENVKVVIVFSAVVQRATAQQLFDVNHRIDSFDCYHKVSELEFGELKITPNKPLEIEVKIEELPDGQSTS